MMMMMIDERRSKSEATFHRLAQLSRGWMLFVD
jgi:hypothetical protein